MLCSVTCLNNLSKTDWQIQRHVGAKSNPAPSTDASMSLHAVTKTATSDRGHHILTKILDAESRWLMTVHRQDTNAEAMAPSIQRRWSSTALAC